MGDLIWISLWLLAMLWLCVQIVRGKPYKVYDNRYDEVITASYTERGAQFWCWRHNRTWPHRRPFYYRYEG